VAWTERDIPSQAGRVAVVTGANGGLGAATATALAAAGAHVVLAARNPQAATEVCNRIARDQPGASLDVLKLDLGSLASVASAAERLTAEHDRLDLLIANAGLMAVPEGRTEDGFETQFGVNHLGHWALVSHLLPTIVRTPGSRVVTVTSTAQHGGRRVDLDDPHMRRGYKPWQAYSNSKLANRHFAQGLQRQFERAGIDVRAVTAHPGFTHSGLQGHTVDAGGAGRSARFFDWYATTFGMPVEVGALTTLRAATDPDVPGGAMVGPKWVTTGPPVPRRLVRPGTDRAMAALWEVSRRETGLDVDVEAALGSA
jgi:NAD(P)-dependent dehydrogenase (short-subunit alcohol dehydrogenase family)